MPIEFLVADMTCGHCVQAITAAVKQQAPHAEVTVDLPAHRVTVQGGGDREAVAVAIREAGYDPQPV